MAAGCKDPPYSMLFSILYLTVPCLYPLRCLDRADHSDGRRPGDPPVPPILWSLTPSPQWQFPASNYSRVYHSSDGSVAVQLLCVDTTTLAPSENKATSSSG